MNQLHGYIEFCELGEWYGVIDIGVLLVPNSHLSAVISHAAAEKGCNRVPDDASLAFSERYVLVRGKESATATLSYQQLGKLHESSNAPELAADPDLLRETNFAVLKSLCDVLAGRFGEENVRLVAYLD